MLSTLTAQATTTFYQWEVLGRGWILGEGPVSLEPPFTPFFSHQQTRQVIVDDTKQHTLLSTISSWFNPQQKSEVPEAVPEVSYQPFSDDAYPVHVAVAISIPKGFKGSVVHTEQLLTMLGYCTEPLSFEVEASIEKISFRFVCREDYVPYLKGQLKTYFPELGMKESPVKYESIPEENKAVAVMDYGLTEEFTRPLGTYGGRPLDPYTSLFSIAEQLTPGETILLQVLFNGVVNYWESSILRSVSTKDGKPFFQNAPEMLPLAKEKVSAPILAVSVRVLTYAETGTAAQLLLDKCSFALIHATRSPANSLSPLPDEHYNPVDRLTDIALRQSMRVGMLLNCKELATLVHIPDASLSPKLITKERKTKKAPLIALGHPLVVGTNSHQGITTPVTLSNEQRFKHTHIIGATGSGKSTLLLSMIAQDINQGNGIAIFDPHGDLIEQILTVVPERRIPEVVLIDPADSEYPVGFNILHAGTEMQKEILAADLVSVFKRLSTSWGDQMNAVLANAILALLESTTKGTLADLRRFLIEKQFRETILKTVTDPSIRYYWQKEYPLLKTNSIGPILTRLDTFLRPRLIRNMVCQKKTIDVDGILTSRKILLVKLSQGLIGAENSYLLGTVLVSKIYQAALARQATEKRSDFFVYIDEFQHFITPSMSQLLSGARKYHVGLVLAHQDMQQLQRHDAELTSAIIANAGTRICFRVGESDARKLVEGFRGFEAIDLQNLGVGEAIIKIEQPEFDCSLETIPFRDTNDTYISKEAIISYSRERYSTPKATVEGWLQESMADVHSEAKEQPPPKPPPEKKSSVAKEENKAPRQTPPATPILESNVVQEVVKKKEESQHRYLQHLIKQAAESKGYKATLEALTPDQKGKVDVLLEGFGKTIAIEVSITTGSTWEVHNIEKCIAAGYDQVIVCCPDTKSRAKIASAIQTKFEKEVQEILQVLEPEDLLVFLERSALTPQSTETTYKGYRVKVDYEAMSAKDMEQKRGAVSKIIMEAMRKFKKKDQQ